MSTDAGNTDFFISPLASDPELHDLVADFVEQIPARIAALSETLAGGHWDRLGVLAHQFKSAVGIYGFAAVAPLAGRLELAVRDGYAEDLVEEALADLAAACQKIRRR